MELFDYILVGGGLHNGLIALALVDAHPDVRVALVERERHIGGNQTWFFHADSIPPTARAFAEPLIAHRWPGYYAAFSKTTREVASPYAAATSSRLHRFVQARLERAPGCRLFLGHEALRIGGQCVLLDGGINLTGQVVIDGRAPDLHTKQCGYQKFVGLELELSHPHATSRPWIMDATITQSDALRYFQVFPLTRTRLLVRDSYYAESPDLDEESLAAGIVGYAASRGHQVTQIVRRERGLRPVPWAGDIPTPSASPMIGGYRGGWFHPSLGHAFPFAVRLAETIAQTPVGQLFGPRLRELADGYRRNQRYCRRLNQMLFHWFKPTRRVHAFERFYQLPEPVIRRFHDLEMTNADRARILLGRPPRGLSLRAGLARRRLA